MCRSIACHQLTAKTAPVFEGRVAAWISLFCAFAGSSSCNMCASQDATAAATAAASSHASNQHTSRI
jgi:predicted CxxxxCH...CXXCH cytochrome family protein